MLTRLRKEDGQALTEYALVMGVIVVALVALAMVGLQTGIADKVTGLVSSLTGAFAS
jgi:Flp pilus assembly pilin Flp